MDILQFVHKLIAITLAPESAAKMWAPSPCSHAADHTFALAIVEFCQISA